MFQSGNWVGYSNPGASIRSQDFKGKTTTDTNSPYVLDQRHPQVVAIMFSGTKVIALIQIIS